MSSCFANRMENHRWRLKLSLEVGGWRSNDNSSLEVETNSYRWRLKLSSLAWILLLLLSGHNLLCRAAVCFWSPNAHILIYVSNNFRRIRQAFLIVEFLGIVSGRWLCPFWAVATFGKCPWRILRSWSPYRSPSPWRWSEIQRQNIIFYITRWGEVFGWSEREIHASAPTDPYTTWHSVRRSFVAVWRPDLFRLISFLWGNSFHMASKRPSSTQRTHLHVVLEQT